MTMESVSESAQGAHRLQHHRAEGAQKPQQAEQHLGISAGMQHSSATSTRRSPFMSSARPNGAPMPPLKSAVAPQSSYVSQKQGANGAPDEAQETTEMTSQPLIRPPGSPRMVPPKAMPGSTIPSMSVGSMSSTIQSSTIHSMTLLPDVQLSPTRTPVPSAYIHPSAYNQQPDPFGGNVRWAGPQALRPMSPQGILYQSASMPMHPHMLPVYPVYQHVQTSSNTQVSSSAQRAAQGGDSKTTANGMRSGTPQRAGTPQRSAAPQRSATPQRALTPQRAVTPQRGAASSGAPGGEVKGSIGMTCGRTNNLDLQSAVFILAVHPTGPAGRSGKLEPMQELISVDGWSVYGQDLPTITSHVVGEPGSVVVLEVAAHPCCLSLLPILDATRLLAFCCVLGVAHRC